MGFRIGKHEPIHEGARRVAIEELGAGEGELLLAHEDPVALHEVRKRIKKVRALLDLARPVVGACAAAEDTHLRLVARSIARHRETDALLAVLEAEGRLLPTDEIEALRTTIRLHDHAHNTPTDRRRDLARARRALAGLRRRLVELQMEEVPKGALRRRCRKSYKRARRACIGARGEGTPDALHRWRQRVKVLLNQLRLLRATGSARLPVVRAALVDLDNRLGRARDCATLAAILRGVPVAERPLRGGLGLRATLEAVARAESSAALRAGARLFRRRSRPWATAMFR
jgi:CHAD domain-containing protein